MSRKVFTAGEVLAAADVNSFLMDQTVMSFAGTAARGSAIPSPVEGMYTHLEDTDRLQFWNGSSWIDQSGMVHLNTTSFTTQSTINIDNVFSAAFNNYKIVLNLISPSVQGVEIAMRFRSGGSTNTSVNHNWGTFIVGALASLNFTSQNNIPSSYMSIGYGNDPRGLVAEVNVFRPFLTENTGHTVTSAGNLMITSGGMMTVTNSYDGVNFFPISGTFSGTIRIYGLRNS